jgi:hypothetical protein
LRKADLQTGDDEPHLVAERHDAGDWLGFDPNNANSR